MIAVRFLILSTILAVAKPSPVTLGIHIEAKSQTIQIPEKQLQRSARSFRNVEFDIIPDFELWTEDYRHFGYPQRAVSVDNYQTHGYETPDFSNGLAYPDPFLLTGQQAKRKTAYLYSRELFFGDIPHLKLLLRKQHERKINGIPDNRLGSIRINSPLEKGNRPVRIRSV